MLKYFRGKFEVLFCHGKQLNVTVSCSVSFNLVSAVFIKNLTFSMLLLFDIQQKLSFYFDHFGIQRLKIYNITITGRCVASFLSTAKKNCVFNLIPVQSLL